MLPVHLCGPKNTKNPAKLWLLHLNPTLIFFSCVCILTFVSMGCWLFLHIKFTIFNVFPLFSFLHLFLPAKDAWWQIEKIKTATVLMGSEECSVSRGTGFGGEEHLEKSAVKPRLARAWPSFLPKPLCVTEQVLAHLSTRYQIPILFVPSIAHPQPKKNPFQLEICLVAQLSSFIILSFASPILLSLSNENEDQFGV